MTLLNLMGLMFCLLIAVGTVLIRDAFPILLHALTDVQLMVVTFGLAFRGGTDFLLDLVVEVSVKSFVFHCY